MNKWDRLTCPAQQCTDVGSARLRRCGGPPTSPQRLACRVTTRLPSWRKALWEFYPRSQTWRWPRFAPTLQRNMADYNMRQTDHFLIQLRRPPPAYKPHKTMSDCVRSLTFIASVGPGTVVYLIKGAWLTMGAFTENRKCETWTKTDEEEYESLIPQTIFNMCNKIWAQKVKSRLKTTINLLTIGFLHPNCAYIIYTWTHLYESQLHTYKL